MTVRRDVLPIPHVAPNSPITYDAKDPATKFPPIVPLRPPAGAPNVLVILLDDVGFGASSAFGGPCHTPNAERLAGGGLKYTRFHTTALCAPTRSALLTGRNHHSVGMGSITEVATAAPGLSSLRPNTAAPLAETLKLNGYSTAQFGKCHEVPVWQTSPMGPFDQWPTGSGFEHFFGFIGGETNIEADTELTPGTHQVRVEFAYDGGGLAKGGTLTHFLDGQPAGSGRIDRTEPLLFSLDETLDVGYESGAPVSPDYAAHGNAFTGEVTWVQIDLTDDGADSDHFITPEERFRVAMGTQ